MKIKKTFQGTVPENKILNTESSSETDTYSCKYINDTSVVVSSTEPTGNNRKKVWMQKGKNLLDLSNKFSETTYRGLAIAKNEDGSITFNGTTTEEFILRIPVYLTLDKGTYTHSMTTLSNGVYVSLDNINDTMITPSENSKTFTLNEKTTYSRYFIWAPSGKVFNNYTFYPMICEGTDSTYEQYIEPKIYVKNDNGVYEEFISKDDNLQIYSAEEIVIGKWKDGKPLYRKVYETSELTSNEHIIETITNQEVKMINSWLFKDEGACYPYGSFYNSDSTYTSRAYCNGTHIKVQQNVKFQNTGYKARVVAEYTKTTD